ncbi:MAG TPA: protein kinase [Gemmatimonadales bacterium]|nr:protein kinase [Gemmatimonadales bacterium]
MSTPIIDRLSADLGERYRIEGELGAGGMATVYRAHDLKHDRPVALKVLRPELAAVIGADRFLHEIKTTANLQHPHILPLHDSGEAAGLVYYVMPYVEGESLRERLTREHQLSVDDAVRIAREVADALDYAHRHGVVHRDIKPENILLHDGRVQVADFGIALAVSSAGGGTRMTETGMSLGTPHYMAPEQAMGEREITPKADIYALGCVLYEMLAGEPPFTGPTAQAIIARVMTEEPRSLTIQRRTIPVPLEAVVRRALEKLPADRFASAARFSEALEHPETMPAPPVAAPEAGGGAKRRSPLAGLGLPMTAVAVAAVGVAVWALSRPGPELPVSRYALWLPESQAPQPGLLFQVAPDGSRLVYARAGAEGTQLWVKERNRPDATPLPGTTGAGLFAVSPDGQWIAFTQAQQVKKISVLGGAVTTLADSAAMTLPGLAWLDDGSIVFTRAGARELRRVSEVGGQASTVWRSDSVAGLLAAPLPGGRGVLFTGCREGRCGINQDIWVLDLRSGDSRRLIPGAGRAQYLPTGQVLYVRPDGAMFVVGFDLSGLATRGSPVPILDSVAVVNNVFSMFSASDEGTLVVRQGSIAATGRYQMAWVDRAGRQTPIDTSWTFRHQAFGANAGWALSPDGSRLAIGLNTDAGDDIWVKQLPDGPLSRVSFDSASEYRPRWSPDGRKVGFGSFRATSNDWYQRNADGTGRDETVLDLPQAMFEGLWSRDGTWLVVRTGGTLGLVGGRDIYALRPGVDSAPRPIVVTPEFDEAAIALSPDGKWLAYESNETGRTEVFIRPFPDADRGKVQVSNNGGVAPLWARNGREFFYVNANREMVAVPVGPGTNTPQLGERRTLFRLREELYLSAAENYTPYDISPDGNRFIMARRVGSGSAVPNPLIVTEHWFRELREKEGRR